MMSKSASKIEILVVNHKPSYVPDNALLKPIQVGAALASKQLDGMAYYDNVGDSISERNRSYCELTAIYWAWKNLDLDYYGLFHYRRYLSFAPDHKDNPFPGKAYSTPKSAVEAIHLNEDEMRAEIEKYDLIIPRKDDSTATTRDKSIYEQYKSEHNIADLDYCLDYVKQHYPDIAPFTDVLHQSEGYFCNMFIMNKELFNEYCSFIFDVLESFEKNNDISLYNPHQYRVTGFIAERLTNIFIQYVQARGGLKVKELQVAFFENTDPEEVLHPVAKEDNVAIVLAANNFYVPYMSTLLRSVANNTSNKHTYDVTIFHRDITAESKRVFLNEFKEFKNLHIRFYDMSSRASEYSSLFTKLHFTVETYFRLFIQDIMVGYDKVLYLDGDMIVKSDVAELYNEDVEGYLLAACRDIDMAGIYNSNILSIDNTIDPKRKDYIDNTLKIKKPFDYFQAGVILFNLKEMRKSFSVKKALTFAGSHHWEYLDQDVLNYFAQGKVKYLDMRWNVLYDWEFIRIKNVISKAPIGMYLEYMESRKDPKIIHYGGMTKPWQRADCDFADSYWEVARDSAFYELILGRMGAWVANHKPHKVKLKSRVIHKMRRGLDKVAPKGTPLRKPITLLSQTVKKVLY